jgi:multisubunit Na+/H+ antiporter MnhB subunit
MVKTFRSSLIMMVIMSLGIAILLRGHDASDISWMVGLMHGLYVGVMFVATGAAINVLYQNKSLKLWQLTLAIKLLF